MPLPNILRTIILSCIWTALPILAVAQNGAVTGTVTDPDGNPISAAVVTVAGVDGPSHSASTSAEGEFLLQELPSGTYTVRATAPGFAAFEQSSVAVAVGRTTHLSLRLTLAGVQQTVNVTSAASAFDASQSSSVVNIDRDRVEELPIPSPSSASPAASARTPSPGSTAIASTSTRSPRVPPASRATHSRPPRTSTSTCASSAWLRWAAATSTSSPSPSTSSTTATSRC